MIVVCAWCQSEGRPSVLYEREPLEDRSPTHTVCVFHRALLLEELKAQKRTADAA